MSEYIIANVDFVKKNKPSSNLFELKDHPLSYLSFFLGSKNDITLVPKAPTSSFLFHLEKMDAPTLDFELIEKPSKSLVVYPWNNTLNFQKWISTHLLKSKYPYHPLQEELGCKLYAQTICRPQFFSSVVHSASDLLKVLEKEHGTFVLKQPSSQSGQGHFFIDASDKNSLLAKTIDFSTPLRLEPWVERVFDFSSQWLLDEKVYHLGSSELLNTSKGAYLGSIYPVQNKAYDDFINEHIKIVMPIVQEIFNKGYRGHIGIDAFVYLQDMKLHLCPLIEINPRKTMGFLALHLANHYKKPVSIKIGDPDASWHLTPLEINSKKVKKSVNLSFL